MAGKRWLKLPLLSLLGLVLVFCLLFVAFKLGQGQIWLGGKKYVCPENNTIDCMPIIQGEKEWFCSDEYLSWAEENCPEFTIAF